jgi:hypothetical protein
MLPGGNNSTRSGGNPNPCETSLLIAAIIVAWLATSFARDSATITSRSVPLPASFKPNATTQPFRIPSTRAANSSTSWGYKFCPPLMMMSFTRPVT